MNVISMSSATVQDDEEVQVINLEVSRHKDDIWLSGIDYIRSFFHDKKLYCGSPIPDESLYTDNNISLVINSRMSTGIDVFYDVFADEIDIDCKSPCHEDADIAFLLSVYLECAYRNIPKQYAAGIAILYLKLCAALPRKMRASA